MSVRLPLLYSTILTLTLVAFGAALYGQGERLLAYSSPVRNEDAFVGVVQFIRSLADWDRSLCALGTALTVGRVGMGSICAILLPAAQSTQGLPSI